MIVKMPFLDQLWKVYELQQKGDLVPVALPGSIEVLQYYHEMEIEPIVVTADIPEAAKNATKPFVDIGFISSTRVYAIQHFGSKKEQSVWKRVQGIYYPEREVIGVYEDTLPNLEAAVSAHKVEGLLVDNSREDVKCVEKVNPKSVCIYSICIGTMMDYANLLNHELIIQRFGTVRRE